MLYLRLFFSFFKVGIAGFGGGYAMLSMILAESAQFSITPEQMADLNALDMMVPGPIAINAATYVGYLAGGFSGALAATIGVCVPSFLIVIAVMRFMERFRDSRYMADFMAGVRPAAVGLIAAAAMSIAAGVLTRPGMAMEGFWANPWGTISPFAVVVFALTAVAATRFRMNPILLTVLGGIAGAFLA